MFLAENGVGENKENQRIMRNLELHETAIFFIRYRTEKEIFQHPVHIALIKYTLLIVKIACRQCFRFLIKFVKGSIENQHKLRDHIDVFVKYIDKFSLASQLIYEVFKENKKFLNLVISISLNIFNNIG